MSLFSMQYFRYVSVSGCCHFHGMQFHRSDCRLIQLRLPFQRHSSSRDLNPPNTCHGQRKLSGRVSGQRFLSRLVHLIMFRVPKRNELHRRSYQTPSSTQSAISVFLGVWCDICWDARFQRLRKGVIMYTEWQARTVLLTQARSGK